MPSSPPHACAGVGCPELVPRGRARCALHERKRDRERGTAHERGYTAEWRRYSERYLAEHPDCYVPGCPDPATVTDHIKAHKGDPALFWDPTNHRPSCKPHHDQRVDEGDFKE